MSEEPKLREGSGEQYDAPNQEVVRGEGPASGEAAPAEPSEPSSAAPAAPGGPSEETPDYAAMTKEELVELSRVRGISPANLAMTKDDLVAGLKGGGR